LHEPASRAWPAVSFTREKADLNVWEKWVNESPENEMRPLAFKAIRTCVENRDRFLDLSGLALTGLPDGIPPHIEELDLSGNKLRALPRVLPLYLKCLRADKNRLTSLPENLPLSLEQLHVTSNRLKALPVALPESLSCLMIMSNKIRRLPDHLPASLQLLGVSRNRLTSLPESMPRGLLRLEANSNKLSKLPKRLPPELQSLHVDSNRLKRLPDTMPGGLRQLHVDRNRLTQFPMDLPLELEELSATFNRISLLPIEWPLNLRRGWFQSNRIVDIPRRLLSGFQQIELNFDHNPLGSETRAALGQLRALPSGSRIGSPSDRAIAPNLADAVCKWFPAGQRGAICQAWADIAREPRAGQFARFLNRLTETADTCGPKFTTDVTQWLLMLSRAPTIRNQVFLIAFDAAETCEDRAALALCNMWAASTVCKLEMGILDKKIPKFIDYARRIFRSEKLADMARDRVALVRRRSTSSEIDEISIYLTYQAMLHDDLKLLSPVNEMRFFTPYYVRRDELPDARLSVTEDEDKNFPQWLSSWSPWEGLLKRQDRELYDAMYERLYSHMDQHLENSITAYLCLRGLPDDEETRQSVAPYLSKYFEQGLKLCYGRQFLRLRGQLDLLNPVWSGTEPRGEVTPNSDSAPRKADTTESVDS
jgi:hypothetical protein